MLRLICFDSFAVHRFVRPQLVSLIIHPCKLCCILFCSCLCSSIRRQGLAFWVRSIMLARLITLGDVVLRLRGFGSCCSEAGSSCVKSPPNRELSEPFGRSGPLFTSSGNQSFRCTVRFAYPSLVYFVASILSSTKKPKKFYPSQPLFSLCTI